MKLKKMMLVTAILFMMPAMVTAGQIEGSIEGYNCVLQGKTCPAGQEAVIAQIEKDFVLLAKDGDWYTIPNVEARTLSRYLAKEVRITGDVNKEKQSIFADTIELRKDGKWKEVWSLEMMRKGRKFLEMGP